MSKNKWFIMSVAVAMAIDVTAGDCYVSTDGSDNNPGTKARPLATLQAAVDRLQPGETCLIRGGTYRESVVFPRSGTADKPITLKPYRGEKVIVSGCDPVTGWTPCSNGIWKARMPWTLGTGRNQIFSAGRVLIEARYPNAPAPGLEMPVGDLSSLWPTYGEFSIPKETRVSQPGRIVSQLLEGQPDDYWKGALYCGVHFEGWCAQTGVIESSRAGEIMVGDRTKGWWFGSAYDGRFPQDHEEGRGMIVGHLHALDMPGEWHWQDDTLYLMVSEGSEPEEMEAKRRQLAFDLSGCKHIRIEGIAVQAASMRLENSAYCTVEGCDLAYISHYTRHYGIGQIEHGRDTIKSGETGIYVSGHDNEFLNCSVRISAGTGFHLRGYHHTIHNCLIDEVSYVGHYLNAITDAVSDFNSYENFLVGGHVITFNTMRNAGRHFFNFYGNGTSTASRNRGPMDCAATLFAHNHLYNGMLLTRDAGFLSGYFCSGGTLNNQHSQVAYNVMHDCYDLSAIRWNKLGMVYLDEGTCNVDVHHNLFWAAPGALQRDMWFNTCCVGIQEYDNLFHGLFTRTCAELRPDDFPDGRPFRFGHDFGKPPALPAWPRIDSRLLEAGECVSTSDGLVKAPGGLTGLKNGDWFIFDPVDFDAGWSSAVLRFASGSKEMNTDRSARAAPRHCKVTDPLVLEAKVNDGRQEKMRMQWTFFYNVEDGAWIQFNQVPLGEGYRQIRAVYGNDSAEPWQLEVRLDRVDGPLVGQVALTQSDRNRGSHVQIYREAVAELAPEAKGTRDVFLVFKSEGGKPSVDFEYFRFEHYCGELPLQKNEVKLELHTGGRDGPKIGEFYPRFTGGDESFREFVATLGPAQGREPLCVVVRSALSGPIGTVAALSLQKAGRPVDASGIGVAPLRKWWGAGGMILPEPTNLPRPESAGRHRQPARNRPLWRAANPAFPVVIDGKLEEWSGAPLELKQTLEGVLIEEMPVQAWVGFDDEAFYVAMRNPVRDGRALLTDGHRWGTTDGVEIALQSADANPPGPILTLRGWPDGHFSAPDLAGIPPSTSKKLAGAVTYRAVTAADSWTCEWRIPLELFGSRPATLLCNLTARNTAQDAWRTWRTEGGATYDLHNGGTLILASGEQLLSESLKESLVVWLDAADKALLETDADGKVSRWKDRSGRGHHAVQSKSGCKPLYVDRGMNGRPALQFDDAQRTRMELPDLSDQPMTVTVFAVVSNPEPGQPQNHDPRIFTASNGKEYDYLSGLCCSVSGMQTGGPRQIIFEGRDRWVKHVRVGCFSPNEQTFFKGGISEILVFERALTQSERFMVTAYLMTKWEL